ncbi:MAG: hypothetical protein WCC26_05310 [Terracidiphilus sp.]
MKLAVRVVMFALVVAGAAAASFSSSRPQMLANHISATSALPGPGCGPGMGCPRSGK